ncbi:DUF4230 domain-containing protein [Arsenicibacter rosenii]|uniref:DUF4230 domain-containing protein n=1 Tax=Arsenicibacter rosenii TaxID=1750698 RepID=A0A1S2VEF1_9BACT|nr:DUF4230 domain-containing protein [Arsenicibacter rosenii]OIN57089.1 hypothetical protein BLX24_21260 [Arsenicibacter rosenii]
MRLLRFIFRLLLLVLIVLGLLTAWEQLRGWSGFGWLAKREETTQMVVLQEITAMGKVELVKYRFKDIVEHSQIRTLLPNAKAVLIVEGEAVGCIDLTRLTAGDISPEGDTVVVRLPQPELCSWKIDHQRSRVYDTEYGFMDESALVNNAFKLAEKQIQQSALNSGILEQTKQNADRILRPVLEKVSGKKVILTYQTPPTRLGPLR